MNAKEDEFVKALLRELFQRYTPAKSINTRSLFRAYKFFISLTRQAEKREGERWTGDPTDILHAFVAGYSKAQRDARNKPLPRREALAIFKAGKSEGLGSAREMDRRAEAQAARIVRLERQIEQLSAVPAT